jgi:predicted amidophosphoribosyltransferase
LCRPGDALHGALRRYKDAPAVSARRHYTELLASLLEDFLSRHAACMRRALGDWDAVCTVPSSGRGGAARPFDAVVGAVRALHGADVVELAPGSVRARHLSPAAGAFRAPGTSAGRRVLVVDDTWVTGARARSAAAALGRVGAEVAGVLAVGRSVDPEVAAPWARRWWEGQLVRPPDLRCGLECGPVPDELLAAS